MQNKTKRNNAVCMILNHPLMAGIDAFMWWWPDCAHCPASNFFAFNVIHTHVHSWMWLPKVTCIDYVIAALLLCMINSLPLDIYPFLASLLIIISAQNASVPTILLQRYRLLEHQKQNSWQSVPMVSLPLWHSANLGTMQAEAIIRVSSKGQLLHPLLQNTNGGPGVSLFAGVSAI